jgi:hypothetical protein
MWETELGDVLNYTFPGVFGDVLDFLQPIMVCTMLTLF